MTAGRLRSDPAFDLFGWRQPPFAHRLHQGLKLGDALAEPVQLLCRDIIVRRLCRAAYYAEWAQKSLVICGFPKQIRIALRCAGWRESEVNEWMKNPMFYQANDATR